MSTNQHLLRHAWWDEPASSDAWAPYLRLVAAVVVAGACIAGGFLAGKSWAESQAATPRLVVAEPRSVTIAAYGLFAERLVHRSTAVVTIPRGRALSALVAELNSLRPISTPFATSCPVAKPETSRLYLLHFGYGDGDRLTVRIEVGGCRSVSAPWFGVAGVPDSLLAELDRLLTAGRRPRAT